MTTLGTSTWGVVISTGIAGGVPSGDIIYFLCNDVQRQLKTKDKTDHYASQTAVTIALSQIFYSVTLTNALYQAKTFSSLNSHHALLHDYIFSQTKIYLWLKDAAGTYLDFEIGSTVTDYLPCVIKDISDKMVNNKFTATLRVEETA
jgi:hypothetical protein